MTVKLKLQNNIINGAFDYWQRGTSFAAIATGTYTADRWFYNKSGGTTAVHTISRSTNIPTSSLSTYSTLIDCTTADASVAASELVRYSQRIEGYGLRSFKSKKMVMAFWVSSPKTGIHSIALKNSAFDRTIVKEYTVTAANTWERKIIRFEHDSTGVWDYTTGLGLQVSWTLAAGTDFQTTPDTWQSGNFYSTPASVNLCDSTANDFYLSDIVMVEDNEGQTREPEFQYSGSDVFEELELCQRYYEKSYGVTIAPASLTDGGAFLIHNANTGAQDTPGVIQYKVFKRVTPALTIYNPVTGATGTGQTQGGANVSINPLATAQFNSGPNTAIVLASALAINGRLGFHWTADAEL